LVQRPTPMRLHSTCLTRTETSLKPEMKMPPPPPPPPPRELDQARACGRVCARVRKDAL
jgi:hypothetical protein